jgi:ADP-ribosylglycohydrolase
MKGNEKAMVLGSFLADSFSLGVHWIYDTTRIEKEFGRVESFLKPLPGSYHSTKDKGEFTHYGDQAMVLLESIASKGLFDLHDFSSRWQALFRDYRGYYDQATKATLSNLAKGKPIEEAGAPSSELAGAGRIAPLVALYRDDPAALVNAAKAQTRMTHNDPLVIESAEFFARVSWMTLRGQPPADAMKETAKERFDGTPISLWVEKGLESKGEESVVAIGQFGQSCHVDEAFPGIVHLISRHENDLKEALIQCVMSGGDNAGRGMIVGMVLGAYLGEKSLPREWLSSLKKKQEILKLLSTIP